MVVEESHNAAVVRHGEDASRWQLGADKNQAVRTKPLLCSGPFAARKELNKLIPYHILQSTKLLQCTLDNLECNPHVCEVLNRTVLNGGKMVRSILTFMMADMLGIDHQKVGPFSRAIEMIHASSLAHDDVTDDAHVKGEGRQSTGFIYVI